MKNSIDISSLNVKLGGTPVLQNLSLQIPEGQWCSIVGPSGCGKSTLLRAVANLVPRESEKFETNFETPAFVFQDPTLMPWRTVWDNVRLPMELQASRLEVDSKSILSAISMVGLAEADLEKYPRELSGGMRMRVSMARALVTRPDILFMDEPFAALDELLRQQLNQLSHEICRDQQLTTLFVTHNVSEAVYLSERILVMNDSGVIIEDLQIALPKERSPGLRTTPEYLQSVQLVTRHLQEAMP